MAEQWFLCFSHDLFVLVILWLKAWERNSCSLKTFFGRYSLTGNYTKKSFPKKFNVEVFGFLEIPILTGVCKNIMAKIWIFPKSRTKCMTTLIWTVVVLSFSVFCWCHSLLSPCRAFVTEYVDFYSFSNLLLCTSKWWEEIMKTKEGGIKLKRL